MKNELKNIIIGLNKHEIICSSQLFHVLSSMEDLSVKIILDTNMKYTDVRILDVEGNTLVNLDDIFPELNGCILG